MAGKLYTVRMCLHRHVAKIRGWFVNGYFFSPVKSRVLRNASRCGMTFCGRVLDWLERPDVEDMLANFREAGERAKAMSTQYQILLEQAGDSEDPEYADRLVSLCLDILEPLDSGPLTPREEAAVRILDSFQFDEEEE